MTAQEQIRTMTADEFLALPESNLPHELIDGVTYMAPAPELNHQDISGDVFVFLKLLDNGRTYHQPTDVRLDERTVVQPDVLWLAPDTATTVVDGKYIDGAPDLIVEILSPGTAKRDRGEKYDLYEQHGVREYWIIEPSVQLVEVYFHTGKQFMRGGVFGVDDTFKSRVLGADVPVAKLFKTVKPNN